MDCAYCGGTLTRRSWHGGTKYNKTIWQCVTSTKKGKKFCPDSKGIPEEAIEKAFLESYRIMCNSNKDVLEEFLQRMENVLSSSTIHKELSKIEKEVQLLESKKNKLVDMRLEDIIDKETYEEKFTDILQQINEKIQDKEKLTSNLEEEKDIKKRLLSFKKVLEQNEFIETFDRYVFESVIEKVIVGGTDEEGNKDPAMITFVYKTGLSSSLDGNRFKPARKNAKNKKSELSNELCSHAGNEDNEMYPHSGDDTC